MASVPEADYTPTKDEPGPREVFEALREAFIAANGRLRGASIEEIAEHLIVGGHLQKEPSLALVGDVLAVLEAGGLGLRSPALQPCSLEVHWDAGEGRVSSYVDLSWNLEWTGAALFAWERQGVPEKFTHAKTPPCTDLISEPEAVLRNKERWPIHVCSTEFMSQGVARWALAQPFVSDSLNIYRWASMYPLPVGRSALMACERMDEAELLSEWSEVLSVLPFEEDEKAMWALRVEHREAGNVHTLDLFGLAEYPTKECRALEFPVAGTLAYSVRGKGKFPADLIDLLDAAERWWNQFRGRALRGRPPGTGIWKSPEDFREDYDRTTAGLRAKGIRLTREKVAEQLRISDQTLNRWINRCGINWRDERKS